MPATRHSGRRKVIPVKLAEDRAPWERQPFETDKAWDLFTSFRDMGTSRDLTKMSKALGIKVHNLHSMSAKYGWTARIEAYDRHIDKIEKDAEIEARRKAVKDMTERHLRMANHMQRLVQVELLRWIKKTGADEAEPDMSRRPTLSTQQIQALLECGVKLERLNRDEPESIIETRTPERSELEAKIARLLKARKK